MSTGKKLIIIKIINNIKKLDFFTIIGENGEDSHFWQELIKKYTAVMVVTPFTNVALKCYCKIFAKIK